MSLLFWTFLLLSHGEKDYHNKQQCPVFESSNGDEQSFESHRLQLLVGAVSLSVFGSNFVLAKVRLGLISVQCLELREVPSRRFKMY